MHHLYLVFNQRSGTTQSFVSSQYGFCKRSLAMFRIKPHAPPLVRVPVNLSSTQVVPQAGVLNALAAALISYETNT